MKMKSIFLSVLAVAALASCNNDDASGFEPGQSGDQAYLSVALNSAAPNTYAESGPADRNGTSEESTASSVVVVGLRSSSQGVTVIGSYTLNVAEQGTIGVNGTPAAAGEAFKVSKDIDRIFVIINPTTAVSTAVSNAVANKSPFATMNQAITENVSEMTKNDHFMMTSAGVASGDNGLTSVSPTLAASESAADIATAKNTAKANSCNVKVDRAMVKTSLNLFTGTAENGTASIDGWKPNTTNTKYFPYAELVNYSLTNGGGNVGDAKYRQDPNWSALTLDATGAGEAATQFNWLDNKDYATISWNSPGTSEYVLENTMEAAAQNYNNTTKIIIKAKFTPTGVTTGESWFRVGGIIKTFAELKADYVKAGDPATSNPSIVSGYDAFAVAMFGAGKVFSDLTFGDGIATSDIETVENAGYKAACVAGYMVEYFQKSVCYYDVNLKHDNRVEAKLLGRWGVVRNNFYALNITKISQAGKPYIPDPTDPDIKDPENPDPDNPTPDDDVSAFISVTIDVNPWTAWVQEAEL